MILENPIAPFFDWMWGRAGDASAGVAPVPSALWIFLMTAAVLTLAVVLVGYVRTAIQAGPVTAISVVGKTIGGTFIDIVRMSPRRVLGLTILAVREALRRHIWVALVIYLLVLMFASWILDPGSDDPAKLYLSFVLSATTYLILLLSLFVAAFSLPADIKNRTIHTVVTKPTRPSEIVAGRLLGFVAVGTVLLAIMGVASYIFVGRALAHTHELTASDLAPAEDDPERQSGETSRESRHQHEITFDEESFTPGIRLAVDVETNRVIVGEASAEAQEAGILPGGFVAAIDGQEIKKGDLSAANELLSGEAGSRAQISVQTLAGDRQSVELVRNIAFAFTETDKGHWHRVTARWEDGQVQFDLASAEGIFNARVPIYGALRFRGSEGDRRDPSTWQYSSKGVNTGNIFTYRSCIRGNSLAAAIWTFEGLRAEEFPRGLPLDLTIGVYRGHKGDVSKGVRGSYIVRNPDTQLRSKEVFFTSREYRIDRIQIPRHLVDGKNRTIGLFEDLVTEDGRVEIWIRCFDPGQYFCMAPPDLYVRAPDGSYSLNFVKRYVDIWLQMVLIICLAVFFSTFLSGPLAMLSTATTLLLGLFSKFLYYVVKCNIFRYELQSWDRLKMAGFNLDETGYAKFQELHDAGRPPFVWASVEGLQEMKAQGLHDIPPMDRVYGGGPLESAYRIVTQENLVEEIPLGALRNVMELADRSLMHVMDKLLNVLPNFEKFSEVDFLAHGYDIPAAAIWQHVMIVLAFMVATFVGGYLCLKLRELAR